MFGIGSTELLVILVVALIVLGPRSLANVSRMLGKAMGEFRRVSTDFQRTLNAEAEAGEEQRKVKAPVAATPRGASETGTPATENAAPAAAPAPASAAGDPIGVAQPTAAAAPETPGAPTPPPGSPLAEALAQTRARATAAEGLSAADAATAQVQTPDAAHGGKA